MRLRRLAALIFALVAPLCGLAQPSWVRDGNPAFLDDADRVTVWLASPARLADLKSAFKLEVNGRTWTIRTVLPRQRARPAIAPEDLIVAGTLQRALGAEEWDPAGIRTRMTRQPDGTFELVVPLPVGRWEYKIAKGGNWGENWGRDFIPAGDNIVLVIPTIETLVRIVVDQERKTVHDSINQPDLITPPSQLPLNLPSTNATADQLDSVSLVLDRPIEPSQFSQPIRVRQGNGPWRTVVVRGALDDPRLLVTSTHLGATWSAKRTTFRVWSPVSQTVAIRLFKSDSAPAFRTVPMQRNAQGLWTATIAGNWHGTFYQYDLSSYGRRRTAADIYSVAASADSTRSMVVDLSKANPTGWPARRPFHGKPTDAILYEAHVRDLTVDPSSGVRTEWRGKYLGLTQTGTRVPGTTFATGLDYLRGLGITHLHLLPWQNFNPGNSQTYNWGYETTLFNVPEEQYSTRRRDPLATIREAKTMIAALQRAGIGAVLDVVYNHSVPSEGSGSAFWETVPYYWFRTNDRGEVLNESGVGNALHDERPMVRKYIRDSLVFWTREYRMDGFRFDLLGMFTPDTVRDITRAVRREFPAAILYGEPWTGGGPTRFPTGAQRGTGMAIFNDRFRGAFRGDLDGTSPGFTTGGGDLAAVKRAVVGSVEFNALIRDFAAAPGETVNYISAHDNLTLRDRIARSLTDPLEQARALNLCQAAILLSQGIPFIEGGTQLGRTKGGNRNSYNAGDAANRYDWSRAMQFRASHDYLTGLIALRRRHPALRLVTTTAIQRAVQFVPSRPESPDTVAWTINGKTVGDEWGQLLIVLHGSRQAAALPLPPGQWNVAVDDRSSTVRNRTATGKLPLAPLSAYVLWRK